MECEPRKKESDGSDSESLDIVVWIRSDLLEESRGDVGLARADIGHGQHEHSRRAHDRVRAVVQQLVRPRLCFLLLACNLSTIYIVHTSRSE